MHTQISKMPDHTKVWVYIAHRLISPGERTTIEGRLRGFCERWTVHGQPAETSFEIRDDHFLVLAADEERLPVSGCSIDSSVQIIRELSSLTGIDFLNRSRVPFFISQEIVLLPLSELRQKYRDGIWNGSTETFNTLAPTLGDIRKHWRIPASKSWVSRYMDSEVSRSLAG